MGTVATIVTYYAWGNAAVSWNDAAAGKTWADFGITDYKRDEQETVTVSKHTDFYTWADAGTAWSNGDNAREWADYGVDVPSDRLSNNVASARAEHFTARSTHDNSARFDMTMAEQLTVADVLHGTFKRTLTDTIRVSRKPKYYTWRETATPWNGDSNGVEWRNFGIWVPADELRSSVYKHWAEQATAADRLERARVTRNSLETLHTSDTRQADLTQPLREQVIVHCLHENHVGLIITERAARVIERRLGAGIMHQPNEVLSVTDPLSHAANFKRKISEDASVADRLASYYGDNIAEAATLQDTFLKLLRGALGDVGIRHTAMTMQEFQQIINQPAGYEPFIPYIVGEYEYQKALVRLSVVPGSLSAEPAVYNAVIHVDIDDTVERGESAITDTTQATTIRLTKHFYTKPEITVALRAGSTKDGIVTPNIADIAKDDNGYYFKVELIKADGTLTAGRISWTAVGY